MEISLDRIQMIAVAHVNIKKCPNGTDKSSVTHPIKNKIKLIRGHKRLIDFIKFTSFYGNRDRAGKPVLVEKERL